MQAYAILFCDFLAFYGLRAVLLVVRIAADFPQVRLHGLLATGGVALREERGVVLVDLHEVFTTQLHCLAYRIERPDNGPSANTHFPSSFVFCLSTFCFCP